MQLPAGVDVKEFNPNRPNQNFSEFVKAKLRAVARGLGLSYATLTGDLREVNFSSIRQGVLEERDAYRVVQTFAIEHICQPIFEAWLEMALVARQVSVPYPTNAAEFEVYFTAANWQPRGWTWVDPVKDVQASIQAIGASLNTLQQSCAERGLDWRAVMRQRKREIDFAQRLGLEVNLSTPGEAPASAPQDEGDPQSEEVQDHA